MIYDGKGNPVEVGGLSTSLANADILAFGDSNVNYSYGSDLTHVGSMYYRLWAEFGIKSLVNNGHNGAQTCNVWTHFRNFFTETNIAKYNKESTIIIIHSGTNDHLNQVTTTNTSDFSNTDRWGDCNNTYWGMDWINQFIQTYLPKAKYFWVIPMGTMWSKWTGSNTADDRNMEEKYPYFVEMLNHFNFPYIDAYAQSGISPMILSDGIHLGGGGYDYTTIGTEKYYRFLRAKLMEL